MSDPISCHVRVSSRARHVSLRMTLDRGLEVVVPIGFDARKIPAILERKRAWIDRVRQRLQRLPRPEPVNSRPEEIFLPAVGRSWIVEYAPKERPSVVLRECEGNRLLISGNIASDLACRRVLQKWLVRQGRETLLPWLKQMSEEAQLPNNSASVRLQRQRRGDCPRRGTTTIIHMNHSRRFWDLVASKEPDYRPLDRHLVRAMRLLPGWVHR